jgi:hypothetical protein
MSDTDPQPGADRGTTTTTTTTTAERVRRGLDYALLGGMVLLGAFAALQFYLAADRTINVWVTREYRPPFKMLFNLVVLLVVGVGVSRQVRRLTGRDGGDGNDGGETESGVGATPDGGTATDDPGVDPGDPDTTGRRGTTDAADGADRDDASTETGNDDRR